MPGIRRGVPVNQLARDYGMSLEEFSESIISVIGQEWAEQHADGRAARQREICAAVSAAMLAAFDASTLAPEERARLEPVIREVLLPFWTRRCGNDDPELAAWITARANHYLQEQVPSSRVKSAVNIVGALLEALDVPSDRRAVLSERLVPAFAHRMVSDLYRINDVRRRQGIELSLLATVCALMQASASYDPILRLLRMT